MSVNAAFHSAVPVVGRRGRGLRAAFSAVLDRLAASPLDSPVLQAMGTPHGRDVASGARRLTGRLPG
ncbi:hypothetical protein [Kitasatospora aureofaciens]|uniref:hypothetical protein n=1 Tax=Kitasatospora aureofaciens TaxID=1894 RepID=UPI001C48B676|nr:hypothetical protein [Kitasatospora aureofaciens]MBV6699923.1 hypothetical protein [Kitasatospora aureofaciens]